MLTQIVAGCFTPPPATTYADLLVDGHRETWPIRSKRIRGWLRRRYYEATGSALGAHARVFRCRSGKSLYPRREPAFPLPGVALKDRLEMMFHARAAQTAILAACSALAFMTVVIGDHAHADGKLDASYTITFARIRVGDITATVVVGDSEYTISARGRAGGVVKLLADGEGSFTTRGHD